MMLDLEAKSDLKFGKLTRINASAREELLKCMHGALNWSMEMVECL